MTWGQGSGSNIPKAIQDQVRRRDKVCQLQYPGCTGLIEEFDHVQGLAERGVARTPVRSALELQGVCCSCHGIKTEKQRRAGLARARATRGSTSKRYRDIEPHPGRLR